MAYAQKVPAWISPEDYLMLEERSLEKHEYLDGVIYDWQAGGAVAMAGADKRHNRASLNVYTSPRTRLRGEACELFVADVRVAADDKSDIADLGVHGLRLAAAEVFDGVAFGDRT